MSDRFTLEENTCVPKNEFWLVDLSTGEKLAVIYFGKRCVCDVDWTDGTGICEVCKKERS